MDFQITFRSAGAEDEAKFFLTTLRLSEAFLSRTNHLCPRRGWGEAFIASAHNYTKIMERSKREKILLSRKRHKKEVSLKKRLGLLWFELKAYYFYFTKPKPASQNRVVIFAQGRTGSTLLENLICSTGYFRARGELLGGYRNPYVSHPYPYLSGLSKASPQENFIFHLKIYHLTRDRVRRGKKPIDPGAFLKKLSDDGWKIIYLKRKNTVRHIFSNFIVGYRGRYDKLDNAREDIKIEVDLDLFEASVEQALEHERAEMEALAGLAYHPVVYEEDLENADDHQKTVDAILDFLSLEHRKVKAALKRINVKSLEEQILNYDEFYRLLEKRGWLAYLAGEPQPDNSNH